MPDPDSGRLTLTVLGCTTAVPDSTAPAAGFLVTWGETALLLDVGQGVVRRLMAVRDPRQLAGVIVGHMHADHYLDLAGLRYLFPWAEPAGRRLPVHLPPGGTARLSSLADAISERPGFFDVAFAINEYDPGRSLDIGPLTVRFARARHYVPAWAVSVEAPGGSRLVYTGDTGPSEAIVAFAAGADLLVVESALERAADDDPARGHLTVDDAIDLAERAAVREALVVHYAPARLEELRVRCASAGSRIRPAVAGDSVTVAPARQPAGRPA